MAIFRTIKTLIICLRLGTITDKKSEECFSASVFDDMQCVSLQTNILHTFSVLIHICKRAHGPQSTKNIQDNSEHKKRLLLDILKERGIFFDLETKKIIDDKTSLETILRVLQSEKEREIKNKKYHKVPRLTEKSSGMEKNSYESVYDSWYIVYKLYVMWVSRFTSNVFLWWT